MRQRIVFHNDKEINPKRGQNSCQNIYLTTVGACKYIKQTLTDIKGESNSKTVIVGNFNTPLATMGWTSTYKINKETVALSDKLDHMDLIDIFWASHPNEAEYTFKYT